MLDCTTILSLSQMLLLRRQTSASAQYRFDWFCGQPVELILRSFSREVRRGVLDKEIWDEESPVSGSGFCTRMILKGDTAWLATKPEASCWTLGKSMASFRNKTP